MPMNIDDCMKTCSEEVNRNAFHATVCGAKVQVEQLQTPLLFSPETTRADVNLNQASINLKTPQNDDADINRVITLKIANRYLFPHERKQESHTVQQLLRERNKLKVGTDGVLYRLPGTVRPVVLPGRLRQQVYKELHEEMGYLGSERVIDLAREQFFWPHMKQDITHYVTNVLHCLKSRKPVRNQREPLHPIVTTLPF